SLPVALRLTSVKSMKSVVAGCTRTRMVAIAPATRISRTIRMFQAMRVDRLTASVPLFSIPWQNARRNYSISARSSRFFRAAAKDPRTMSNDFQGDGAIQRKGLLGSNYEMTFGGVLSFMRRTFTKDLSGADLVVSGVPFDLAVTDRPGARLGPNGIRAASAE